MFYSAILKKKNNANMFSKGNLKLEIKNLFGKIKFVSVFPRSSIFFFFVVNHSHLDE